MPTIVTKSIGSGGGRDYSTIQAWEDACPANLVTDDKVWKGECYDDSTFDEAVTISGETVDSTHYLWLTAASGQSHVDQARTVARTYGMTGAKLTRNTSYSTTLTLGVQYCRIERMQLENLRLNAYVIDGSSGSNAFFTQCIVKGYTSWSAAVSTWVNCLIIVAVNDRWEPAGARLGTMRLEYCTLINTNGGASTSLALLSYETVTVENCAWFGWATGFTSGSGTLSGDYNCTDYSTAPGAHSKTSKTFANQFVSTTNDFRAKSGADLENGGTPATSYATDDISATVRSASTPTMGAWELAAAGAAATSRPIFQRSTRFFTRRF
jgi:hypothetical protein